MYEWATDRKEKLCWDKKNEWKEYKNYERTRKKVKIKTRAVLFEVEREKYWLFFVERNSEKFGRAFKYSANSVHSYCSAVKYIMVRTLPT